MLNKFILVILGFLVLSGTIAPVYSLPPLERVINAGIILNDQSGREVFHAVADQVVLIEASLKSWSVRDQQFAYVVQIKDANRVTVLLAWLNGQIQRNEELKVSQSWVPEEGHYFIEAFVWAAIDNPDPLSPVRESEIEVFSVTESLPFDFNISTEPEYLAIQKGTSAELLVTVESIGEEIQNVRLLVDNVPNGISVELEQDFEGNRPPYSLPMKISVANSVVLGTYSVDIVGESNEIQRSIPVKLTVVKEDLR